MQVKTLHATMADMLSARALFSAVFALRELYWPGKEKLEVLDAFARNGQLTVNSYRDQPGLVFDAWELGVEHHHDLFHSGAREVRIGCSYRSVQECQNKYDMVVIDTPQGLHADHEGQVHAEHFDFLPLSLKLLPAEGGVVVLYVNKNPYNPIEVGDHGYDQYSEFSFPSWMAARDRFYNGAGFHLLEGQALTVYRYLLLSYGYEMLHPVMVPCLSDVPGREPYAFRLAFKVVKK